MLEQCYSALRPVVFAFYLGHLWGNDIVIERKETLLYFNFFNEV